MAQGGVAGTSRRWWGLAGVLLGVGILGCGDGSMPPASVLERPSVGQLTEVDVEEFVRAVKRMKTLDSSFAEGISAYDYFVELHVRAFAAHGVGGHGASAELPMSVHGGPLFLPWHREFVRRFELELQRAADDSAIAVPWWDWTDPAQTARVFEDDFAGGDGDLEDEFLVKTGPFRVGEWQVSFVDLTDDEWGDDDDRDGLDVTPRGLQRNFGGNERAPTLPVPGEVADVLGIRREYDVAPWDRDADPMRSFRNLLEGFRPGGSALHNRVHLWVGGQMGTQASPNDPVFFLHHAMIDRIWDQWQEVFGVDRFPNALLGAPLFGMEDVVAGDVLDLEATGVRYAPRAVIGGGEG